MEFEELKLLGLNSYEIRAYVTLLEKGENKASFIAKNSKIPTSKIYETLSNLETKGLVYSIPKKIKEFGANSIEIIEKLLDKKEKELETTKKKIEELKKIPQRKKEGNIIIVEGKKGFEKLIRNIPETKTDFVYSILWKADTSPTNLRGLKQASKDTNNNVKLLIDKNVPKSNINTINKYCKNIKTIESNGIAVEITKETALVSILELNQTIFIHSKDFSHLLKQLFEVYYNNS